MSQTISLDEYIALEGRRRNFESLTPEEVAQLTEFKRKLDEFEQGYRRPGEQG